MPAIKFTETIKQWLAIKKWTQRDLADHLGVDESYVSLILTGRRLPSYRILAMLCELSGLGVDVILKYDPEAEAEEEDE